MISSARKTISVRVDPDNHSFLQNQKSISDCVNSLVSRERLRLNKTSDTDKEIETQLDFMLAEQRRQDSVVQKEARKLRFLDFEIQELVSKIKTLREKNASNGLNSGAKESVVAESERMA